MGEAMEKLRIQNGVMCIGSITFVFVLPKELEHKLLDSEIESIENAILNEYRHKLETCKFTREIQILNVYSKYGCLEITIDLGFSINFAVAIGALRDYETLKNSLICLAKDIEKLLTIFSGKEVEKTPFDVHSDFSSYEKMKEASDEAIKNLKQNTKSIQGKSPKQE